MIQSILNVGLIEDMLFCSPVWQYKCQSARKNCSGNDDGEVSTPISTKKINKKMELSFDNNTLRPPQENLRSADFSTTLTVFGLKPRSGEKDFLVLCAYPAVDCFFKLPNSPPNSPEEADGEHHLAGRLCPPSSPSSA